MAVPTIKYDGKDLSLSKWADELGISKAALSVRINEFDFNDRRKFLANLTAAQKARIFRPRSVSADARKAGSKTVAEWAAEKGVSRQAIHQRLDLVGTKYKTVREAMDFEPK